MKIVKIVSTVMALILPFSFFGCKKTESEKDKKYDVAIRVRCDKRVYEFPIGVDEIHDERYYDMSSHSVYVETYQLIDSPWEETWFTPYRPNTFSVSILYTDLNDGKSQVLSDRTVKERGDYVITIRANQSSSLWNYRKVKLYIKIK